MSVILGLNAFHADAAACLVVDGVLLTAIAEERMGDRKKHTSDFPFTAIGRVLSEAGMKYSDITDIAVARDSRANLFAKGLHTISNPMTAFGAVKEHVQRRNNTTDYLSDLRRRTVSDCGRVANLHYIEHHIAHLASSYYTSGFDGLTAGLSYDGSGDFVSLMAARCEGNSIKVIDRVFLPDSLGIFYTALCQFIGFAGYGEEFKVMGLAPYGNNTYEGEMKRLIREDDKKWLRLNRDYFEMHKGGVCGVTVDGRVTIDQLWADRMRDLLGEPRKPGSEISQRHMDIARSAQVRFEEIAVHCVNLLHTKVKTKDLIMAGGCALNGVANARILRDSPFENCFIHPAASDDGTSVGAAFYVYHSKHKGDVRFRLKRAALGPSYNNADIAHAVEGTRYRVSHIENEDDLVAMVAELIAVGKVVGWYQGGSEWGPRALGNRSILANPLDPRMKDTINSKIKKRESFRPFAPSVLAEDASIYFEQQVDSPFMMHVIKFKPEWASRMPSVAHIDGTGRVQTVDKNDNPLYYKLISEFKARTGVGVVLNTSFNENEPIVDSPAQAYDCFLRTDMDALCMGSLIVVK